MICSYHFMPLKDTHIIEDTYIYSLNSVQFIYSSQIKSIMDLWNISKAAGVTFEPASHLQAAGKLAESSSAYCERVGYRS